MQVNFGKAAKEYAKYRAGFPPEFFVRLLTYQIGLPGQKIVDLATGTGTIARGLAKQGCSVIGLDLSATMIEQAKILAGKEHLQIDFIIAKAEETGLPDQSVDIVTAGQCWHWFDRLKVIKEIKRILKNDGKLVIAHFDWLFLKNNVVDATENLIHKYNPNFKKTSGMFMQYSQGTGIYPLWLPELQNAGFKNIETFSFDMDVPYSHLAWRKRIIASAGVGASLSSAQVKKFDKELAVILQKNFHHKPLLVPHRVFAIITRR